MSCRNGLALVRAGAGGPRDRPRSRIKQANAAAKGLFGYAADELINEFVEHVLPERFRRLHLGLRKEYLTRPEARPMGAGRDLYARQRNGMEFPVEIGLNPMEVKG